MVSPLEAALDEAARTAGMHTTRLLAEARIWGGRRRCLFNGTCTITADELDRLAGVLAGYREADGVWRPFSETIFQACRRLLARAAGVSVSKD